MCKLWREESTLRERVLPFRARNAGRHAESAATQSTEEFAEDGGQGGVDSASTANYARLGSQRNQDHSEGSISAY